MLKFLKIENFALMDRVEIEFRPGLTLITGETGSGKSILVDAVGLLAGERASQDMVRQGSEKARIEGIFELSSSHPARLRLREAGIEPEEGELIIRREISLSGANKIFINGSLSTLGLLAEVGVLLADIHGQHEQQLLLQARTHLAYLDAFGGNRLPAAEVAALFSRLREAGRKLERVRAGEQERLRRLETLRYQIDEIESLRLKPGLDTELEREKDMLASAEKRCRLSRQVHQLLYEQEDSVLGLLSKASRDLQSLAGIDTGCLEQAERVRELLFHLEELAFQVRDYASAVVFDPARLEAVQQRLAEIQKARGKYGSNLEAVLEYHLRIRREAAILSEAEQVEESLLAEEEALREAYLEKARALSAKRAQDALRLQAEMERELSRLAMENTLFRVALQSGEENPSEQGIDTAEFLISPNPGESPRPLSRIVSGGELSRVILALKSIITVEEYSKTLVFDEVDSGIGGRVASAIGEKLARLAKGHQVFCVTHLPQIACHATDHFLVDKQVEEGRTLVRASLLGPAGRVGELARMMAGESVTPATLRHAEELILGRLGSGSGPG
jgi:DNA repair protein RecN (Recombination protein N)